jgi:hydrogenase maturation protease
MPTLIIGLGNEFAGDDGIGIRVARVLVESHLSPDIDVIVRPSLGFGLLDAMETSERIVLVDAMSMGGEAGACVVYDAITGGHSRSVVSCSHLFGIADVLEVARRLSSGHALASVQVVGIEGVHFDDCDTELSAPVRAALPVAVETVLNLVAADDSVRTRARDNCAKWMQRDPTSVEVCEFRR